MELLVMWAVYAHVCAVVGQDFFSHFLLCRWNFYLSANKYSAYEKQKLLAVFVEFSQLFANSTINL